MKLESEECNPTPRYKNDDDDEIEDAREPENKPATLTESDLLWIRHAKRTKMIAEQSKNWAVVILTVVSLLLCVVFYIFNPDYLFLILLFSAILCPFFHPMNAPLWLAIVLLTVSGWTFTTGVFSIKWSGTTGNPFTQ